MFLTKDNHLKWKWIAVATVITVALVITGIIWFDAPVYLFLRRFDCRLLRVFGYIFDWDVWFIVAGISLIAFYIKKAIELTPIIRNSRGHINLWAILSDFIEKTKNSYAFYTFCSIFAAGLVAKILKTVIGRGRPVFFDALGIMPFVPFSVDWAFNSMPSGHTVAAFSALVMLGMLAPKLKPFTWTTAIIIGVSRVCVGAHWPTDVILGAFIGMLMADFIKYLIKSYADK